MKEHELSGISMQGCRETNWPGRHHLSTPRDVHWYAEHVCMSWCEHAWTCVRRVRKKLVLVSLACKGGLALGLGLALPWRKGKGRRRPAREGWHNSPILRGEWPG
ncbi:hypothetical protein CDL15_Pgr026211 [Punica granatum]|uniref:Uncharacterized protein n=1 Tax=Punica granatum TaxID=22663 RepID=A0A218VR79_PUNGR|nr:hypothetical protein CDL15_Pgr026211 [Punica granatum]